MVQFGFNKDVREMRVSIKDFVDSVTSAPHLELTEPLKLYIFAVHVVEFPEKENASQQRVAEESSTVDSLIACFCNTSKPLKHFETVTPPRGRRG